MGRLISVVSLILWTIAAVSMSSCAEQPSLSVNVKVGLIIGSQRWKHDQKYTSPGKFLKFVFYYMIDKLNNKPRHQNDQHINIKYLPITGETYGNESESIKRTIDFISNHKVDVILGPQETCSIEPKIASIYNVPMVSHYCSLANPNPNDHLNEPHHRDIDNGAHPQLNALQRFIQTKPPYLKLVERVLSVVEHLINADNWYPQRLILLYYKPPPKPSVSGVTESSNSDWRLQAAAHTTANKTGVKEQVTYKAKHPPPASLNLNQFELNSFNYHRLVGEALEIRLRDLLISINGRRRRQSAELEATHPSKNVSSAVIGGAGYSNHMERDHVNSNKTSPPESIGSRQRANKVQQVFGSLAVLNWHKTTLTQAGRNPYQKLLRRHLSASKQQQQVDARLAEGCISGNESQQRAAEQKSSPSSTTCAGISSSSSSNSNSCSSGHSTTTGLTGPETASNAAIYIVVGHYYEHLGLMLALDQLQLFDDGGNGATDEISAGPSWSLSSSSSSSQSSSTTSYEQAGGQSSVVESIEDSSGGQVGNQRRLRNGGSGLAAGKGSGGGGGSRSIVVGVDIEPYDEHGDDSVRFLPPAQYGGYSATAAAALEPSSKAFGRYIGVAPSKPTNMEQILDGMQHYYNKSTSAQQQLVVVDQQQESLPPPRERPPQPDGRSEDDKGKGEGTQSQSDQSSSVTDRTSLTAANDTAQSRRRVTLTARRLKLIRLSLEAFYLHDSLELVGNYFDECIRLNRLPLSACSQRHRVLDWFANRDYNSSVNNGSTAFDANALSEGVYSIVMRTIPPNQQPSPSGFFDAYSSNTDEDASNFRAHVSRLMSGAEGPNSARNDDDETVLSEVGQFVPSGSGGGRKFALEFNVGPNEVDPIWLPFWCQVNKQWHAMDPDGRCAELEELRDEIFRAEADQYLGKNGSMEVNQERRQTTDDRDDYFTRMVANKLYAILSFIVCSMIGITCLLVIAFDRSDRLRELATQSASTGWFDEQDELNFLQIVHTLLLVPETIDDDMIANGNDGNDDRGSSAARENDDPRGDSTCEDLSNGSIGKFARAFSMSRGNSNDDSSSGLVSFELLHCYMFPFPSCKFVHWIRALHQLKELLFQYQSNANCCSSIISTDSEGTIDLDRRTFDKFAQLVNKQSTQQRQQRRNSGGGGDTFIVADSSSTDHRSSTPFIKQPHNNRSGRLSVPPYWIRCQPSVKLLDNKIDGFQQQQQRHKGTNCLFSLTGNFSPNSTSNSNSSATASKQSAQQSNSSQLGHKHRRNLRQFFTGYHKSTSTVRLLLNKFKSTNHCLCELSNLRHGNIVELRGITLGYSFDAAAVDPIQASNSVGNRCARLLLERPGRGCLRDALRSLDRSLDIDCCERFKLQLIKSFSNDIVNGLKYLHHQTSCSRQHNCELGFHGNLSALTCLITTDWRLKLSGFHSIHLQRSLGDYQQRDASMETSESHEARLKELLYMAPECIGDWRRKCALNCQQMRLADIYSMAFVMYELLASREPWSCATSVTNSKLLLERIQVDPCFRPPLDQIEAQHSSAVRLIGPKRASMLCKLLESCWSLRAADRPRTIRSVRSQLESALGPLGSVGNSNANDDGGGDLPGPAMANTMDSYVRLLETSSSCRLDQFRSEQRHNEQLEWNHLPNSIVELLANKGNDYGRDKDTPVFRRFDNVSVMVFRFAFDASVHDKSPDHSPGPLPTSIVRHHWELLNTIDDLVATYCGHLHLLSSEVDSTMRFAVIAGEPLADAWHKPLRRRNSSHVNLLASFALHLIDCVVNNKCQTDWPQRPMMIRIGMHCGPACGYLLSRKVMANQSQHQTRRFVLNGPAMQLASLLEQTGKPQHIHISRQFKDELQANPHLLQYTNGPITGNVCGSSSSPLLWLFTNDNNLNCSAAEVAAAAATTATTVTDQLQYVTRRRPVRTVYDKIDLCSFNNLVSQGNHSASSNTCGELETHWLLNGPRLTTSRSLILCSQTPRQLLES